MYEIILKKPATKFLRKLDLNTANNLLDKIEKLRENPFIGKPLSESLRGLWIQRYDKYRIIYQVKKGQLIIFVLNIGHRKKIY